MLLPELISSPNAMGNRSEKIRKKNQTISYVATMGCLHEGHLSLIRRARELADVVIVSIFVNPLQFGKGEDFEIYPRVFELDRKLCSESGVDIIFCPSREFARPDIETNVTASALGQQYCGKTRPVFFDGVLTIVTILFQLIRPHFSVWGEKDFQQLFLIRRLMRDLWFPIEIISAPIVREADGLAMSSRNRYIKMSQRKSSLCLVQAIQKVKSLVARGEVRKELLIEEAERILKTTPDISPDYVAFVDPNNFQPIGNTLDRPARLLLAANLGTAPKIRLIDNSAIELPS